MSHLYIFKAEEKTSKWATSLGYSISIIVAVINYLISWTVTKLCVYEGHQTHTGYYCSLTTKLLHAYFFNSGLIILFVSYKERDIGGPTGLIYNVMYIQFFAAFITPMLTYFDP